METQITQVIPFIIPLLAGGVLFSAFVLSSRVRLFSFINWFRIQSFLLVLYVGGVGVLFGDIAFYVSAVLIILTKVILVPLFLGHVGKRPGVSERLESYVRPAVSTLLAAILVSTAFFVSRIYMLPGADYLIVAASLSLVLIGFLLLITRKDLFGQGMGFLTLENGIFTFGIALVHGMPLLLEIGILFDVLIGFVLMMALVVRAQDEHKSTGTDHLRELTG